MKKMKSYKIYTLLVTMAVLLMNISCSQDEYLFVPKNNCVTFQSVPSNGYQLDGSDITVEIVRGVASEPLTLNVSLADGSIYTLQNTAVTFAQNEYKATLTLTYDGDNLEAFVEYPFELSFDAAEVSPSGTSSFKAVGQVPFSLENLEYEDYGLVYCENYMFESGYDFDGKTYLLQLAKYTKTYYRIKNFMGSGTDFDFCLTADGTLEIISPDVSPTPEDLNSYDMYRFDTEFSYNGEQMTMWFDSDAEYNDVVDQGETYTMVEGTYFSNYSIWSTPSVGLLTAEQFRDDQEGDDGWWRFYVNVKTVF